MKNHWHFPDFHRRRDLAVVSWVSLFHHPRSPLHCCCCWQGCRVLRTILSFSDLNKNWWPTLSCHRCWRRWRRGRSSSGVSRSRDRAPWCGLTGNPRAERWLSSNCGTLKVEIRFWFTSTFWMGHLKTFSHWTSSMTVSFLHVWHGISRMIWV